MIFFKLSEGNSTILDLIRGISAQLVVVGHGISMFGIFKFLHEPNIPWMQNAAVLVFFLLSGFLITYSTLNKLRSSSNYGFKQYFSDRFSRIYAAFIPSLLFVLLIDFISRQIDPGLYEYSEAFDVKNFVGNLFMFQDFPLFSFSSEKIVTSFGSARPFWTLAIEWWIYMWFGFIVLILLKQKLKIKNLIFLMLLSIVPVFNLLGGRGNSLTMYWIFGSMIYLILNLNILASINKNLKILTLFGLIGVGALRAFLEMDAYDPVFAFILAIILGLTIDLYKDKKFNGNSIRLIKFNASYSYTLYLIHYSILDFIFVHFGEKGNPIILFVLGFIFSNIVSYMLGSVSEIKLTKFVKKWMYAQFKIER